MAEEIAEGLERAFRTRNIPSSNQARISFLVRSENGSTAKAAQSIGVSQRTIQRWAKGGKMSPANRDKLEKAVQSRWQPRVRQRQEKKARESGFMIHAQGRLGFSSAEGSTDDPRMRIITQHLPADVARQVLSAPSEAERREAIQSGLAEHYFETRMDVEFTDIQFIDFDI